MLSMPFYIFWLLLCLCRGELGWKGIAVCVAIWVALLAGCLQPGWPPYLFVAAQAILDAVLILILLGGDIRIRG